MQAGNRFSFISLSKFCSEAGARCRFSGNDEEGAEDVSYKKHVMYNDE